MNKFFFALLILALFVFEIKADYIPPALRKKVEDLIAYFKKIGKWDELIRMVQMYDDDYVVHWCMEYSTYQVCEALIDDYLDYYD